MKPKQSPINKTVFKALQAQEQGNIAEASLLFRKALATAPTDWMALFSLGRILANEGKHEEAIKFLDRLAIVNAQYAPGMTLRGVTLEKLARHDDAAACYSRALSAAPNDWTALFSLGRILHYRGRHSEAIPLLDRLVLANPNYAPGLSLRGAALEQLGRYDEALADFGEALRLVPGDIDTLNRRGALLGNLNRAQEAAASYERALAFAPHDEITLANLGKVLYTLKRFSEAEHAFKRLLDINPDFPYAKGLYTFNNMHQANWTGLDAQINDITAGIRSGKRSCMSLAYMSMSDSAKDLLDCVTIYAQDTFPRKAIPLWNGERYCHDRIRIAYVSADFREHPVGHLMAGIIERHDRARFETIALSFGIDDKSRLRSRFMSAFDNFVDVSHTPPKAVAELIRQLEVDIAVDLSGYTYGAHTEIFASRVAPIQVNFLGYPGTMGTDYMDYILADRHVIPEADRANYAEAVAYLPDTYLPSDSEMAISEPSPTREAAGLPSTGFVFCSFNHIFKINPQIFDAWMSLLSRIEGSVLWLSRPNDLALENLRKEAAQRGIDPQRLIFAERIPRVEDHLARYRVADLFLDTMPYNAHTTAADALFAGLPVVTYSGNMFASRVAGSLLNAIGLPDLITHSMDAYIDLAAALASDPQRLAGIKARLAANKATFPLFDATRFCRQLEAAFITMWERQQRGEPPGSFAVEPVSIR